MGYLMQSPGSLGYSVVICEAAGILELINDLITNCVVVLYLTITNHHLTIINVGTSMLL